MCDLWVKPFCSSIKSGALFAMSTNTKFKPLSSLNTHCSSILSDSPSTMHKQSEDRITSDLFLQQMVSIFDDEVFNSFLYQPSTSEIKYNFQDNKEFY